ncbi:MAG: hypothetical protein ACR2NA_07075 [Solirubrobacterales bacterium]
MWSGLLHARGATSVEHAGLLGLVAVLVAGWIGFGPVPNRDTASLLVRRLTCAPRLAPPCHRDPLLAAYGSPVAHLVRRLAPMPSAAPSPDGLLLPVDFRRCRRPSCARVSPSGGSRLTASNRRTTAFVSVTDHRRATGELHIDYWLYRPRLGWQQMRRTATGEAIAASRGERLTEDRDPRLVPLETLPDRRFRRFSDAERPPWRGRVGPPLTSGRRGVP